MTSTQKEGAEFARVESGGEGLFWRLMIGGYELSRFDPFPDILERMEQRAMNINAAHQAAVAQAVREAIDAEKVEIVRIIRCVRDFWSGQKKKNYFAEQFEELAKAIEKKDDPIIIAAEIRKLEPGGKG